MSRVNLADAAVSCEASSTMSVSSRSSGRGGWLPEGADGLALVLFIQVVNRAGTTVFVAGQGERRFRGNVFPAQPLPNLCRSDAKPRSIRHHFPRGCSSGVAATQRG